MQIQLGGIDLVMKSRKPSSLIFLETAKEIRNYNNPVSFVHLKILTLRRLMSYIYRVEQEECASLQEGVLYVKVYRYNPKHLYPKLNGLGDNGN